MKKVLIVVFALILLLVGTITTWVQNQTIPNPYRGQELALNPLPSAYKLEDIPWEAPEADRIRECYPPIPNLEVDGCIHYTNADTVNDHQFAQLGRTIESGAPRLFWRSSGEWTELKMPIESFYTEGFVEKNNKVYLVVTSQEGCGEAYCLYLIDLESGKSEKQPPASDIRISPDKKKIAFVESHGSKSCKCNHTIIVWDVESGVRTPLATLREADPGSGGSFYHDWSTDSNLLKIEGRQNIEGHVEEFLYIYDQSKKKLFKS